MASITSLMGTSSSGSIYGSRNSNIISGLATGMDTESMIEGAVQGYQSKITSLEQERTMAQWQQEGYQGISNKLIEFSRNYMSYTSSSNLFSSSFFASSSLTNATGENAGAVSANGKSSSEILINSITQLATAQQYGISTAGLIAGESSVGADGRINVSTEAVDLSGNTNVSTLEGSMTLTYGEAKITINFDELEFLDAAGDGSGQVTADMLAEAIKEKLADENVRFASGATKSADELIDVKVVGGSIAFEEIGDAGNGVSITGATGKLADTLNLTSLSEGQANIWGVGSSSYSQEIATIDYLKGKSINFELDGNTKSITVGDDWTVGNFMTNLQDKLDVAYGTGKIQASQNAAGELGFSIADGSTLKVSSDVGSMLGMGEDGGVSSTLDSTRTLGDLGFTGDNQTLTINGVDIGTFTADSTIEDVVSKVNGNDELGFRLSYSNFSGEFLFTAEETGVQDQIEFGGTLGQALFGDPAAGDGRYIAGQDAQLNVTVNGQTKDIVRTSNTVNIDGMDITLKDTFSGGEAIEFSTQADADKIVNAIKSMIEDYNEIASSVKTAYTEQPLQKSDGSDYLPLIDSDKASMSESEIEAYEEKVKTGQFFMDSDLRGLSDALRDAVTSLGVSDSDLAEIGIGISYSSGLTTLTLDETKLRGALESDPDMVEDVFTRKESSGATSDGLMAALQEVTNLYAKETGEPKGILIELAGSKYAPTTALQNEMLTKLNEIDDEIEEWQDKLTDRVDYYTRQFTQLEVLVMEMNNQSSSLMGMMGG